MKMKTSALILSSRSASSRSPQAAAKNTTEQTYALRLWTPGTRTLTTVAAEQSENLVEPVLVTPRPVANRFPTALHAWKTTNLLALNSYISRDGDTSSGTVAVVRVSTLDASGKVKVFGDGSGGERRLVLCSSAGRQSAEVRTAERSRECCAQGKRVDVGAQRRAAHLRRLPRWARTRAGQRGARGAAAHDYSGGPDRRADRSG